MSAIYHTQIVSGASNAAATWNDPMGQLDQAIKDANTRISGIVAQSGTSDTEVVDARDGVNNDGTIPTTLYDALVIAAQNIYDVKAFGATGDGTTNDTAAIISACDTASAAGGGRVYFPAGTYHTESLLELDTLENLILEGDGAAILTFERLLPGWVNITDCTNITLRNLRMEFTDDTIEVSVFPIVLERCSNCRVENVTVIGHRDATETDAEGLIFRIASGINLNDCTYCTVTGCHVEWARVAYRLQQIANSCNGNSILNCSSADCLRFVMFDADTADVAANTGTVHDDDYAISAVHHNRVIGCHALRCLQMFTKVHTGAYFNVIANNTIEGGGTENAVQGMIDVNSAYTLVQGNTLYVPGCLHTAVIYVEATGWHANITGNTVRTSSSCAAHGIRVTGPGRFVTVTGNTVDMADGTGDGIVVDAVSLEWTVSGNTVANAVTGIHLDTPQRGSVTGNNIFESAEYGMYLYAVQHVTVTGNSIIGTGYGGIVCENSSAHVNIVGNTIFSVNVTGGDTDVRDAHIGLTSGCNHFNIVANTCMTATAAQADSIYASGTDSVNIIANHTTNGVTGGSTNSNTQYNT